MSPARSTQPAVLLLHGLGASSHVFGLLRERLEKAFAFHSVELSHLAKAAKGWTPAGVADALDDFCQAARIPAALVVAHSFGGVVALELLARHPRRVRGLMLASVPALGLQNMRGLVGHKAAPFAMRLLSKVPASKAIARSYLKNLVGPEHLITEAQVEGYVRAMRTEGFFPDLLVASKALTEYRLPLEALRKRRVPIRVVWGDKDRLVPVTEGEHLARALDAPFVVLPQAGHCVPEERPDDVAELLCELATERPSRKVRVRRP